MYVLYKLHSRFFPLTSISTPFLHFHFTQLTGRTMHRHRQPNLRLRCLFTGCSKICRSQKGLTKHVRDKHSCANRICGAPGDGDFRFATPPPLSGTPPPPSPTSIRCDQPEDTDTIPHKRGGVTVHPHLNGSSPTSPPSLPYLAHI
jgi:hypothetical protein